MFRYKLSKPAALVLVGLLVLTSTADASTKKRSSDGDSQEEFEYNELEPQPGYEEQLGGEAYGPIQPPPPPTYPPPNLPPPYIETTIPPPVQAEYQQPQLQYQQPQPEYQQPQIQYQQPQPEYQQPQYQSTPLPPVSPPTLEYSQPQPAPVQTPPPTIEYQQPAPPPPQPQPEYQAPPQPQPQPQYQAAPQAQAILTYPTSIYEQPSATPYQPQTSYAVPLKQYYQPLQQMQNQYSPVTPKQQVQFYNKPSSSFRVCPKNVYTNPPSANDIQAAFQWAQQQIAVIKGQSIQYMNASMPGWASRHQIFSILASPGVKSDEEGLLIEYVSQYISDRLCMSKWDRQRYLPSLSKIASNGNYYPENHSCKYAKVSSPNPKQCESAKYRNFDGYCNNPWHPYWGKSGVCHIRILSPDYADGISAPRASAVTGVALPSARALSEYIHNDVTVWGPYNLLKMQWGQFINHDITNTAVSSYEGLVDCCKNPGVQGCFPITVSKYDRFYSKYNVTCLNFIRSAVCPICQLGPRQQLNKNTAFLDLSHVYGNNLQDAQKVRAFQRGLLKTTRLKSGEIVLPIDSKSEDKSCGSSCFFAGDSRVNQHPTLTALHVLALRRHNMHAIGLAQRHPNWNEETLFQEARRLAIAEYQMITYNEYLPIIFGPKLSAYYKLHPQAYNYTYYNKETDPTTWNEYITAACRFGHSQISNLFSLLPRAIPEGNDKIVNNPASSLPLSEWFNRPSLLSEGLTGHLINGLVSRSSEAVDQWVVDGVRNYLYKGQHERFGGDLPATNVQRGRDHGIPGYIYYLEYCSKIKVKGWQDLTPFFEPKTLNELRHIYKFVENIDLFTGGMSERHAPGADTGLTFACINGIQYYHLKFGDRYYFEHGNQAGSFNPIQLQEIRRSTLARYLCKTAGVDAIPAFAFLKGGPRNPLIDCRSIPDFNYSLF